MSEIQRWDLEKMGAMCLASIRAIHQPLERFHISWDRHPAATSFQYSTRAVRKYVLGGICSFQFGNTTWELKAAEFADLPEGRYIFQVLSTDQVEWVSVFELPEGFWKNSRKT